MNKTVEIGAREISLSPPSSLTIRHEIVASAADNWKRSFGAALGSCWRGLGRPKVKYARCDYNPLKYGGEVIDELIERGEDITEIITAGGIAFQMLADGLISEKEVADVENFTEPEEDSIS